MTRTTPVSRKAKVSPSVARALSSKDEPSYREEDPKRRNSLALGIFACVCTDDCHCNDGKDDDEDAHSSHGKIFRVVSDELDYLGLSGFCNRKQSMTLGVG